MGHGQLVGPRARCRVASPAPGSEDNALSSEHGQRSLHGGGQTSVSGNARGAPRGDPSGAPWKSRPTSMKSAPWSSSSREQRRPATEGLIDARCSLISRLLRADPVPSTTAGSAAGPHLVPITPDRASNIVGLLIRVSLSPLGVCRLGPAKTPSWHDHRPTGHSTAGGLDPSPLTALH
jgi:hypothetical protein